ncbi:hypothetical protein Tco_0381449 [Tanacetum coccineum]
MFGPFIRGVELLAIGIQRMPFASQHIIYLGIHGLGFVVVAIGKKLVVVLVGVVETVLASSTRIMPEAHELTGVGEDIQTRPEVLDNKALNTTLNTQHPFQIGVFTTIHMVLGFILEQGFLRAIVSFITMQFQLCTLPHFFLGNKNTLLCSSGTLLVRSDPGQSQLEALRSSMESSIVPTFETSCKAMFGQLDATFQKGLLEHTSTTQQHVESTHSPWKGNHIRGEAALPVAVKNFLNEKGEVADCQKKLVVVLVAGANSKTRGSLMTQLSNGSIYGFREKIEAPVDPTKEFPMLVYEHKYEEAFTYALQRSFF